MFVLREEFVVFVVFVVVFVVLLLFVRFLPVVVLVATTGAIFRFFSGCGACSSCFSGCLWVLFTSGLRLLQTSHRRFLEGLTRVHVGQVQDAVGAGMMLEASWGFRTRWNTYVLCLLVSYI